MNQLARILTLTGETIDHARLADAVLKGFSLVLRPGLTTSRLGWQLVAIARRPW